ncbi:MAG: hypothetical protein JO348_09865 [Alphaproteobacteria bacterium]|nr:hypothetical protein [Alphaproteobacteria bacterium]
MTEIARKRSTTGFTASETRDALVKRELAAERAAFDAKTEKLRALRLAKEAADAQAAMKLAAEAPPQKTAPVKKSRAKKTK